jgi:glucokinase
VEDNYGMKKKKGLALGIDVGGTKIKAGLVDDEGKVLKSQVISTQKEKGAEHVLKLIEELINKLCRSTADKILGVGLALPGEVDDQRGYCLYCPNLKWGKLEVGNHLTKQTGLPIRLVNDANAACLGEYFYGGGKGVPTFLSITLGTGVGSGLILAQRLYTGRFGSGVEAGHMVIEPAGYPCACGRKGCWETLVSAPGIIRRTKEKMKSMPESKLTQNLSLVGQKLAPEIIFQAFREDDPLARLVVEETISYLAVGLANLINLFNPYKISLGGGVAEAEEIMCSNLIEQVNNNVFPTIKGKVEIFKASQGYYGGVVGAASLWLHKIDTI